MTDITLDGVLADVGNKNDQFEKYPPTKIAWDIKGAGVATTVVHRPIDKSQVPGMFPRERAVDMNIYPESFSTSLKGKKTLLHHSQLKTNSKALHRLKEKIQKQKERSPSAADKVSLQRQFQEVPVCTFDDTELRTRKITKGPIAPKYKGFSAANTRIKMVSSHPNRNDTPSELFVSRSKSEMKTADVRISRVEVPSKRSRLGNRDTSSLERKTHITPSSWRQGQHIAESILGPAVRRSRQPRKREVPVSKVQVDESSNTTRPFSAPPASSVVRRKRPELDTEPEKEKQPKIRHYDQNAVQEYIVKKKEERKRKKSEERKASKEAQAKKQKQLAELYRRQKKYAVPKKKLPNDEENCPPNELAVQPSPVNAQSRDGLKLNDDAEDIGSYARFDQRAAEIMDRLNTLTPKSSMTKRTPQDKDKLSGTVPKVANAQHIDNEESFGSRSLDLPKDSTPSEFMKKLDQYLDDSRGAFDGFGKQASTARTGRGYSDRSEYLGNEFRSNAYSGVGHDFSPGSSWRAKAGFDQGRSNEYLTSVRMRADRIAALKTRADSLNDKMEVTRKMVEQPIVPTRNLADIDEILRAEPAVPASTSLPDVDEILRKYDVQRSLTSLPGSNLRSQWPVSVENDWGTKKDESPTPKRSAYRPVSVDNDWEKKKDASPTLKRPAQSMDFEEYSRPAEFTTEPSAESYFQTRFRDYSDLRDSVSSKSSSKDSMAEEISYKSEPADEYHPSEFIRSQRDEDLEKLMAEDLHVIHSASPKAKPKAPWEVTGGDKHSIINLAVGRMIKEKSNKGRTEKVGSPSQRSKRKENFDFTGDESQSENSLAGTSSISKDSTPRNVTKSTVPKTPHPESSSNVSWSEPQERPRTTIAPRSPVQASLFRNVDSGPAPVFNTTPSAAVEEIVDDLPDVKAAENITLRDPGTSHFSRPFARAPPTEHARKYSPAALEQKLRAELNYQDGVDETLRHLTGVEMARATGAAQQDSASLAQLVKTQQLLHGFELEREKLVALAKMRQPQGEREKESSPQSVGSSSKTPESTTSPREPPPRRGAKDARYSIDSVTSSSTIDSEYHPPSELVGSISEDLQKAKENVPLSRKGTFADKYTSDDSARSRSPYDDKRPPRKSTRKNETPSISTELSDSSVHFDESMTEDEIAEISLRAVVASEGHRRHHRSRSNAPSKKSEDGYEGAAKGKKGSIPTGKGHEKNSGEFLQLMDELVKRYMQEEQFRAHHQAAMLHLRKRAIKEKTEAELTMLKKMKKQARKKGEDEKMPPLEKKQRAIMRRYKLENAEIKKLKAIAKAESEGRKYLLQQNVGRRLNKDRDDHSNLGTDKSDGARKDAMDVPRPLSSPDVADNADSDVSTTSSVMLRKMKFNMKALDEQKLTKREQLLMQRKKQAEQLIAWKERLDREERQVTSIEKKALRTWDKEIPNKQPKKKPQKEPDRKDSDPEISSDSIVNTAPSESSIAEEIASATTDSSASRSMVSPALPNRDDVRPGSSSSETIHDDSQYSDFPLETQHMPEPQTETAKEKISADSPSKPAPHADKPVASKPATDKKPQAKQGRKESTETWSDESISQTPSETEQSDIECRVRALREELNRRRLIAEKLKKKQKQRHKDRLKAQEASLKSQIEAYDDFIRKTQDELKQELGSQSAGVVAKPQIRSPQKNHQGRQQLLGSDPSPLSGHISLGIVGYHRSESESSDKSRTNEDEEMANDASPGSIKSGLHDKSDSSIAKPNKQMPTSGISRSLFSSSAKPRSLIPVPSRSSAVSKLPASVVSPPKEGPQEETMAKKSLDTDITSPMSEKKHSESEDDISEHIDDISEVSSEKTASSEQFPLLDLSSAPKASSVDVKHSEEDSSKNDSSGIDLDRKQDLPSFKIGDKVVVAERDTGVVKYVGETQFASGVWVGVQLQSNIGKNDGSVNGNRYFTCPAKHGIFAPPTKITLLSEYAGRLALLSPKEVVPEKKFDKVEESDSSSESSASSKSDIAPATKSDKDASKRESDKRRLADRLTSGLLDSLLEDSMDNILHRYSEKKDKGARDASKDRDDSSTDDSQAPTRTQILEQLTRDTEEDVEDESETTGDVKGHANLADSVTDDLFRDTVEKVMEIRKQRAMKWSNQEPGENYDTTKSAMENKLDYGKEVEDILGMRLSRISDTDSDTDDKESMTPVRPVSPILGVSQDEWIEDDLLQAAGVSKPTPSRDSLSSDSGSWQVGRLSESLSDYFKPSPVPKEFSIDHDPAQILKLVKNTVSAFHSKHIAGEDIDAFVPDVLFDGAPENDPDDETLKTPETEAKKKRDVDANHIFKMSLIDTVREFMTEVFACKSQIEARTKTPKWQKKRTRNGPMHKEIPKNEEELQSYIGKKVSKLLNLHGSMDKRNKRIGMKWGSQKKKDRVDVILIRELREEEPEWTNYDEDETTVKMQLTDTILDLLLSDTVHCLNEIQKKRNENATVPERDI